MTREEEHTLISKVILYNDHRAFKKLITAHQNGIKNLLLKLTNFNETEMQDIFQETITKIYKNLKSFKGSSRFSTWIYRIAYNTFLNSKARNSTYNNYNTENIKANNTTEKNVTEHQLDVETMIAILRPEEKIAIQLSFIQGFTHKEISDIMNCPLGSVKSLINRGKERIAKHFNNYSL